MPQGVFEHKKKRSPAEMEEMLRLRVEERYTLQQLGDLYGVTRERIRQLLGDTGHIIARQRVRPPRVSTRGLSECYVDDVLKNRFHKHIRVDPETGCWNWIGAQNGVSGYGLMYVPGKTGSGNNKTISPRRFAHFLKYGRYPTDNTTLWYTCKNKLCCNPDHERNKRNDEAL